MVIGKIKSAIESIMFYWADPIDLESLSEILELDIKDVKNALEELISDYKNRNSGIEIKKFNSSYQMQTIKDNDKYIKKIMIVNEEKNLSNSLMESLAIIAYKQPITRTEIDIIRGVNSSSSISTLLNRGLIKELGKLEQPGRPIIYGTTDEFLRVFDLESIENLPVPTEIEKEIL